MVFSLTHLVHFRESKVILLSVLFVDKIPKKGFLLHIYYGVRL